MAIQNFVAGGFYGKLGAMVGQRWKNKRTLRAWVKPKNPRTEAQQANRGRFGGCVQSAQIAMQMNWKAPCWQSESLTEWNLRMKSATMLLKSELKPFDKIPLFPYAYVAKYAIHELKVKSKEISGKVTFSAVGELPAEDRNISVLLGYINASTSAYDMELFTSILTTNEEGEKVFSIEIEDISKVNNNSIYLICSNDDTEHENESIYSSQIGATAKITKIFDTNIIDYTRTEKKHFFTFAEEYFESETAVSNVKLYGVVAGKYETITLPSVTLENFGGRFGFSVELSAENNFHIIAFPSLSNIQIEKISADSENLLSIAENTLNSFSSTDLTREMKAEATSKQSFTDAYQITVKTNGLTSLANISEIKTNAVIAGVFKEWIPLNVQSLFSEDNLKLTIAKEDVGTFYKPIFNSESKIISGEVSEILSEVLYKIDLSNIAVEDTDKTVLAEPEVVSKQSFTDAYRLTIKNALDPNYLDITGLKINAVIAGVFKEWIPSNVTTRTSDGNLIITINKDNQNNSAKPIFNSKSSITEGIAAIELNEVSYGMNLAGITVEDTDKTVVWDNTIRSVVNNKTHYCITLNEKNLQVDEEYADLHFNADSISGSTAVDIETDFYSDEETGYMYTNTAMEGFSTFEAVILTPGSTVSFDMRFTKEEVSYIPKETGYQSCVPSDTTFYLTLPNYGYISVDSDGWQFAVVGLPLILNGVTDVPEKTTMLNDWYTSLNASEWAIGYGTTRGAPQTAYSIRKMRGTAYIGSSGTESLPLLYTLQEYSYTYKYMYINTPDRGVLYEKNLTTQKGYTVNIKMGFNLTGIGSPKRELWTTQQTTREDYGYMVSRFR